MGRFSRKNRKDANEKNDDKFEQHQATEHVLRLTCLVTEQVFCYMFSCNKTPELPLSWVGLIFFTNIELFEYRYFLSMFFSITKFYFRTLNELLYLIFCPSFWQKNFSTKC